MQNEDEAEISFEGAVDRLSFNSQSVGQLFSVSTTDFSMKGSFKDNLDVEMTAGSMSYEDITDGHGFQVFADGVADVHSVATDGFDVEFKGGFEYIQIDNDMESSSITVHGAVAKAKLVMDEDLEISIGEIQNFSGKVLISQSNVNMNCGDMTYDPKTGMFMTEEAIVSGKSIDVNSVLNTVEGKMTDFAIGMDRYCVIGSYELEYTLKDGSILKDKMAIAGDRASEMMDVAGTVSYSIANGYSSPISMLVNTATNGKVIDLSISGDGRLEISLFDEDRFDIDSGKVYVDGAIITDDLRVFLYSLEGAFLVLDGSVENILIEAKSGYTLDPSTYDGFSVVDGKVIFDESKIEAGQLTLSAKSIGNKYSLKVDGTVLEAVYGDIVESEVSSDIMWLIDSDGNIYGFINDGIWRYDYRFLGDLELESVKGKEVKVEPGQIVKSSSDSFYFNALEPNETATVKAPSGLTFVIVDSYLYKDDRVSISNSEIEYEGCRAYEITANGRTYVQFPVADEFTVVYHVINDVPVKMTGRHFVDDSGQMYLETELTSYSVYYLTEPVPEPENTFNAGLIVAVLIIAIALVAAFLVTRRRSSGE